MNSVSYKRLKTLRTFSQLQIGDYHEIFHVCEAQCVSVSHNTLKQQVLKQNFQ